MNLEFGCGKVRQLGTLTAPYGSKALIVTGRSSAKKSGLYDLVKNALSDAGVDSVANNPVVFSQEEIAEIYRRAL